MFYFKNMNSYYSISNQLLQFHEIFYKFWTVGEPVFSNKIETAAVLFDKKKGDFFQFQFNPDFWNWLDNYERSYVIAHECLHVILNHGIRGGGENPDASAVAMDLIVNNILTNNLGLKLTPKLLNGAHFQTIFKDTSIVPKNKSYEYYYNLICEEIEKMANGQPNNLKGEIKGQDHSYLEAFNNQDLMNKVFGEGLSEEEKKEMNDKIEEHMKQAGTESLDKVLEIVKRPRKKRFKWKFLLKKIVNAKQSIIMREYDGSNWIKENRRTALFPNEVMIPHYECEKPDYKYDMWFFQDVSGSCEHLVGKFLEVANSIPDKIFDIKFHTFDTAVREVDLHNPKIIGGGGTAFSIINDYINKQVKDKGIKFPETVVIITDGYGNPFQSDYNRNFHWILTENNKGCIPADCNTVMMNDLG